MKRLPWFYFTIVFFTLYVFLFLIGEKEATWVLKPFLMPFLAINLYFAPFFTNKKWPVLALTFSWVGDVVLMFEDLGSFYFILGLISFFLAHLFYIIMFIKLKSFTKLTIKSWTLLLFILLYLCVFIYLLFVNGDLNNLHIPIVLYAFIISAMLWGAGCLYYKKQKKAYDWIFLGALFFVLSDSLLAINKFWISLKIDNLSFYVILTYLVAQFLIIRGTIYIHRKRFL